MSRLCRFKFLRTCQRQPEGLKQKSEAKQLGSQAAKLDNSETSQAQLADKNLSTVQPFNFSTDKYLLPFKITTPSSSYNADYVVIATGGHASFELIKLLGHNITPPKPALTGLKTKEDFSSIAGVSINDVLFTHKGVSGPKIYEISSINARKIFPYKLSFDFVGEIDLQMTINLNPHKSIKNLLSKYVVKSFGEFILNDLKINPDLKCHEINGKMRDKILNKLQNFEITVIGTVPDGEVVMAGGVDLKEVNSKTLESKLCKNIYFCGEVLDIDGFCGGFNLQNCWSTGYICAQSIHSSN
jgi:predicted Rossmann fold flavoprotein